MILSTKGTNSKYKNGAIINGVITMILGVLIIGFYCFASSKTSDSKLIVLMLVGLFFLAEGLITMCIKILFSKSFVEIYQDRMKGKGIQNFNVMDFDLDNGKITGVTTDKQFIFINTTAGTYKIISDKKTAQKVFDYCSSLQR